MDKSFRKCAPKASPRPLFYFGNQHETAIAPDTCWSSGYETSSEKFLC